MIPPNEIEKAIIVFDEIPGSTKNEYIPQFFLRGRHNILNIFYLSPFDFDLLNELNEIIALR